MKSAGRQEPTRALISLRAAAFASRFAEVEVCSRAARDSLPGSLTGLGEPGVEPLLAERAAESADQRGTMSTTGLRVAVSLGLAAPCARQIRARDNIEEATGAWRE